MIHRNRIGLVSSRRWTGKYGIWMEIAALRSGVFQAWKLVKANQNKEAQV